MSNPTEFPRYLMVIDGGRIFLPFRDAYVAFNSGQARVEFGRYVLNEDFTVRKMDDDDKRKISDAANEYDARR